MDEQLLRYFSGDLTVDERLEMINRIENNIQLKDDYLHLQNIAAAAMLLPHTNDRNEAIDKFKDFNLQIKHKTQRKRFAIFSKYAAIAFILITSTFWATTYHLNSHGSTINTLYVPAGQRAQITLEDGTEVWLNAKSTLTYPSRFSRKNREVSITGEAFFDVNQDKKRPFVVSTKHIKMEVLGTQFNVYSYPDTEYVQTDLIEGSLKIYQSDNENNNIILKPDQQAIIRGNNMTVSNTNNPEHILWKNGIYAFNNERLIVIIDKLQLYYDVNIVIEDPEMFDIRYTGKFRQRDGIEEILRILQKIQPFKIERDRVNNMIKLTK